MRFSVEYDENSFNKVIDVLKEFSNKEVSLFEIGKECLRRGVIFSDYLFVILQHLNIKKIVEAKKNVINIKGNLTEEVIEETKDLVKRKLSVSKLFLTPLEVSKFFQCPRRLWLEKVVLSKQKKEKVGKVWDGEAVHLSIKNFFENIGKKEESLLLKESVEYGLKSFEGAVQIEEKEIEEIIKEFIEELKSENFDLILPERTIVSIKFGLVGSMDLIAFRDNEVYPIEIKYAAYRGKLKKEHLIQGIGEVLLLNSYFRKNIKKFYIFYSQTKNLVEVNVKRRYILNFMKAVSKIFKVYSSQKIPPKSRLPNYKERVCKGCHVMHACNNIEVIKRKKV